MTMFDCLPTWNAYILDREDGYGRQIKGQTLKVAKRIIGLAGGKRAMR